MFLRYKMEHEDAVETYLNRVVGVDNWRYKIRWETNELMDINQATWGVHVDGIYGAELTEFMLRFS